MTYENYRKPGEFGEGATVRRAEPVTDKDAEIERLKARVEWLELEAEGHDNAKRDLAARLGCADEPRWKWMGLAVLRLEQRLAAQEATLRTIAAYDDAAANAYLRATGSYRGFDEPGAVEMARGVLESGATPTPSSNVEGWTGNKCEPCEGHGVRMQDGEERSCPDCAGTGDEYGVLSDPADEINPYEQALRDAVEPFLDWLEQREEGAHIQEVREGLIGVEDVIPDDHVVLGAHLRANKDQGVLTIGHFRRLRAAYDGKVTTPPMRELGHD